MVCLGQGEGEEVIAMSDSPSLATLATLLPLGRRQWVLRHAINPALAELRPLPAPDLARHIMLTIAGIESRCLHRRQLGNGPARSLWQFERGGGVAGVLRHPATRGHIVGPLARRGLPDPGAFAASYPVWETLERDDVLAAIFARLLLLSDPAPLPADMGEAYALYRRTWRPGKPQDVWQWDHEWRLASAAMAQL